MPHLTLDEMRLFLTKASKTPNSASKWKSLSVPDFLSLASETDQPEIHDAGPPLIALKIVRTKPSL